MDGCWRNDKGSLLWTVWFDLVLKMLNYLSSGLLLFKVLAKKMVKFKGTCQAVGVNLNTMTVTIQTQMRKRKKRGLSQVCFTSLALDAYKYKVWSNIEWVVSVRHIRILMFNQEYWSNFSALWNFLHLKYPFESYFQKFLLPHSCS